MNITLGDNLVEVKIIYKNNKNIYKRFKEKKKLNINYNKNVSKKEIEKLIKKNEIALLKMYNAQIKSNNANSYFNYLGKKYIKVEDPSIKEITFDDKYIYYPSVKKLDKFIKDECLRVFQEEIEICKKYFTNLPDFTLKIRTMKTRWGVCNRKDNIVTLNTELLKKDIHLIDYVIIHELCHFYEGNHSKNYWKLVERIMPDYKECRTKLKVY